MILSLHFTILSTILNEIQQIPTFNYILIVNFLGHKQTVSVSGQIQILNMLLSVQITGALLDICSSLNSQLPSNHGQGCVALPKFDTIHIIDTLFRYTICTVDTYCSKYQDKHVAVLSTGPPKPRFNICTTLQDSSVVRNGTQNQFGVEWVVFFGQ